MSKPLLPLTVSAPGFFGLNTQQSGSVLPVGWATKLSNFVFDNAGRIASRKGSRRLNASAITNTPTIRAAHEYVDASGNRVNIIAADNKIFKEVSGTITDISGSITTPTGDNWQFANFNSWCIGYQTGHTPIILTTTGGTFADGSGTMHNGSMVLSAYGRSWTVVDNTLYYSDLLIHNYTGGSSGNFDLASYWPNGMDEAVALADFNGFLVVFGKESIIVYRGADDVNTMSIVEGIDGIGCVARDSVQSIGKDLVFLSSSGVRSLSRTIEDESMPLTDISKHVRDNLLSITANENLSNIKSVYNSQDGFYLLSLPAEGVSYVFDLKFPNQDGTWKVSTWSIAPTALLYKEDLTMLLAVEDGYLSSYRSYQDNIHSTGLNGVTYNVDFEGVWNDFGEEVSNLLKILKSVSVLGSGSVASNVTFKWAVDYESSFTSTVLSFTSGVPSQFSIAQFGIDTFAATGDFERVRSQLTKTGQVVKLGLTADINENFFAVQRIDILAKVGRIGL